jgi:hypothetical protein
MAKKGIIIHKSDTAEAHLVKSRDLYDLGNTPSGVQENNLSVLYSEYIKLYSEVRYGVSCGNNQDEKIVQASDWMINNFM